ncbi:MAG: CBS domain-containing protein [Nitrospiraceae bacterium]
MMTPGIVQIPGDVTVSEAALLMQKEHVPCLLVKDTDSRLGIMTPTDIVKKVVAEGLEPHDVEARAIMSKPVRSIEYDRALDDAGTIMASTGVPLLVVTRQNQPVGILTARDLVLAPKRCDTHISAILTTPDAKSADSNHRVTIIQLSHVGAFVEGQILLKPGTEVVLAFSLPGSNGAFTIRSTVMSSYDPPRSQPGGKAGSPGLDLQFTKASDSDQSRIKTWVLRTRSGQ